MIDPIKANKYSNQILELLDSQDEYTRSDLQGMIDVIIIKALQDND